MLTVIVYFLAATGAIAWAIFLWAAVTRYVPHAWQAAVFTARQWKAEKPKLRHWYRVIPIWFDNWLSPCDSMSRLSAPGVRGYTIYWPGKEPKGREDEQ